MGQVLYDYYRKADEIGGIPARTKLSILTKISSTEAKSLPDSSLHITLFEKSFKTICQEFTGKTLGFDDSIQKSNLSQISAASGAITEVLQKQMSLLTDLIAQRYLFMGDKQATFKRITESVVEAINVERASVWFYNETKTGITSADLFIRNKSQHSSGTFLAAKDFPNYFHAIQKERTLAAHNAHTDPTTSEFSESYLKPLGITSMLDVPIWMQGKMCGVICLEHIGPKRTWTKGEENFAYLMSNMIALLLECQA